ncbi:MAG: hypothetical protein IT454_19990 [Planctomycetes bacterium]|nr:hypothetical protein [Planctomycetota bacterium]
MFSSSARASLVSLTGCALAFATLLAPSCSNAATAASTTNFAVASPPSSVPSATTTAGELAVLATRVGLDAEALAASGVVSGSVASLVASLAVAEGDLPTPLSQLDAAYTSARSALRAAERKIQGGTASASEVSEFPSLEQALATAQTARDGALDSLFASAAAGLTSTQRATLSAIRANRSWKLSTEFLVVSRTEAEWIALRDALSNERTAAKNGDTPNSGCQSLLGTERANSSVAAAKTALDTNLSSVTSAWNAATNA